MFWQLIVHLYGRIKAVLEFKFLELLFIFKHFIMIIFDVWPNSCGYSATTNASADATVVTTIVYSLSNRQPLNSDKW